MGRPKNHKISNSERRRTDMKISFGNTVTIDPKPFRPFGNVEVKDSTCLESVIVSKSKMNLFGGLFSADNMIVLTLLCSKDVDKKVTLYDLHEIIDDYDYLTHLCKCWIKLGLIEDINFIEKKNGRGTITNEYRYQKIIVKEKGRTILGSMYSLFISFDCVKDEINKIIDPIKKNILDRDLNSTSLKADSSISYKRKQTDKEYEDVINEIDRLLG